MAAASFNSADKDHFAARAYVTACKNRINYRAIFDEETVEFLTYAALTMSTRMDCLTSMLFAGASFALSSDVKISYAPDQLLGMNTCILCATSHVHARQGAFEAVIGYPFRQLSSELVTDKAGFAVLEAATSATLLEKGDDFSGKVLWCKDEIASDMFTDIRCGDNFRSNLDNLCTSRNVHFSVCGTGSPDACLLLMTELSRKVDNLAHWVYIYAAQSSMDPEVIKLLGREDRMQQLYGAILQRPWAKEIYEYILRHHYGKDIFYTLSDDAAFIVQRMCADVCAVTSKSLPGHQAGPAEFPDIEKLSMGIPANCDSRDILMVTKCALIIKVLRSCFNVLLGSDQQLLLGTTIERCDLIRGCSLVSVMKQHTTCFKDNACHLAETTPSVSFPSRPQKVKTLEEKKLKRAIILYPGKYMTTNCICRKYPATKSLDVRKAFRELDGQHGTPGFVGMCQKIAPRLYAFFKAPWKKCDHELLWKKYEITKCVYNQQWCKDASKRSEEKKLRDFVPSDCKDVDDDPSATDVRLCTSAQE